MVVFGEDGAVKPRSAVWNLFGEYIRYDGGEIGLRALTALLGDFGVGVEATRVVMSRMRREGWFEAKRVGRQSRYALTPAAWDMLDEGRPRIFERRREPWSGEWCVVIYNVPESARQTRDRLRKRLGFLGFGLLAASTWICPHDKRAEVTKILEGEPEARFDVLIARSLGLSHDREMAQRCWDLRGLNQAYGELLDVYRHRLEAWKENPPQGAAALVTRINILEQYRMFPFQDPDLPVELLPGDWLGRQAHDVFLAVIGTLRPPALEHYRRVLTVNSP